MPNNISKQINYINCTIKTKAEFSQVYKNRKRIYNKQFIIFYKKAENFRYGISINKLFGNAIERNFKKRQLKNIIKETPEFLFPKAEIIIKPNIISKDTKYTKLKTSFVQTIMKIS